MDNKYIITPDGNFVSEEELYHWGIKGMKWGVRRYQNEDGSLTSAGRKRYLNADGSLNEKGKKKFGDSVRVETINRKSAKDMTDEELDRAILRARKEDEYNRLRPEPVAETKRSAMSNLMNKAVNEALVPAVINSGRNALQNAFDKYAKKLLEDKVDPNSYEALKKVYDKLKIEKDIENLKNPKLTWDDMLKKQQYDSNKKKAEEAEAKAEKERQDAEAAERRRRQQVNDAMNRAADNKNRPTYDDFYRKNASRQNEYSWDLDDDVTVEGNARRSEKYTKSSSGSKSTVDAYGSAVYDEPVTSLTTVRNTSSGREYVSRYNNTSISDLPYRNIYGYLPAPKDDDD